MKICADLPNYGGSRRESLPILPIAPRLPSQNGHTEKLIGSIRRECLDHVVVFGEHHLRQLAGIVPKILHGIVAKILQ